jgi:hypothetical protein
MEKNLINDGLMILFFSIMSGRRQGRTDTKVLSYIYLSLPGLCATIFIL